MEQDISDKTAREIELEHQVAAMQTQITQLLAQISALLALLRQRAYPSAPPQPYPYMPKPWQPYEPWCDPNDTVRPRPWPGSSILCSASM